MLTIRTQHVTEMVLTDNEYCCIVKLVVLKSLAKICKI